MMTELYAEIVARELKTIDEVPADYRDEVTRILEQRYNARKGASKMVDLYVVMVIRGLKTLDTVPARHREEVARILAELDK